MYQHKHAKQANLQIFIWYVFHNVGVSFCCSFGAHTLRKQHLQYGGHEH